MSIKVSCALLLGVALVTGCTSVGPHQIDVDRAHYNDIVWQTDLEQLLKNIVRLRYVESSAYFQITNVTASYSLMTNMSMTGNMPASSNGYFPTWSVAPYVVSTDAPTISYAPISNADFVASLQEPVDFKYLALLSHGGDYNLDGLAKLMLSKIGPLVNSPSAVHISVHESPNYKKFYRFVDGIETMLIQKKATAKLIYFNQTLGVLVHFEQKNSVDARLMKKLVGVPADSDDIVIMPEGDALVLAAQNGRLIEPAPPEKLSNVVYTQTRSIEGMLIFLSHGVQVPDEDLKAHLTMERYNNDAVYDWTPLMKNILTVYSSDRKPEGDVMISTYLHHHWFYIKASDIQSKTTLFLMIKLIELGSDIPNQTQGPSLTLPG